jgi:predicted RNase H-like HicB family nuclease
MVEIRWRSTLERAMIGARRGGSVAGLRSNERERGPMSHDFDVVIERDSEGYYVASVPALPGCHTQARSLDELSERIKEAFALYLEVEPEAPEPLDFVGIQRVTVER